MRFISDITVNKVAQCGDDQLIINAARVSTGTVGVDKDRNAGLMQYLMKSRHGSPFEHGFLTVYVHAPIFVFREWHRHRIGWSYSEESARWKPLDPVFWVPRADRPYIVAEGSKNTKPVHVTADPADHEITADNMQTIYEDAYIRYQVMMSNGVAREVARTVLPVGIYSSMYASCNPRSLMAFLSLRTHEPTAAYVSHPQREIEEAARQLEVIFAEHWPFCHRAFCDNGRVAP